MGPGLAQANIAPHAANVTRRTAYICALAVGVGLLAAGVAQMLQRLIFLVTNLSFRGTASLEPLGPTIEHLGAWVILIPPIGGLVVGLMARFGSQAIRGHGIPEAMEQILANESRIPVRMTFLKPLSAAVAIGTGGPFGAEGPIIATGGALGALIGTGLTLLLPRAGVDPRLAALVGMAAMFAGASRALLASVVFAFETTRQPLGLLPLLGGCSVAWLVSAALMKHSIMTERIARRGRMVPGEYAADWLAQWHAGEFSSRPVVALAAAETVGEALLRLGSVSHQGFPVLDDRHRVVGMVMRRQLTGAAHGQRVGEVMDRPAITVRASDTLRHAADVMAGAGVGRLPVLSDADGSLVGMLTRSDLVGAHRPRLRAERVAARARARG